MKCAPSPLPTAKKLGEGRKERKRREILRVEDHNHQGHLLVLGTKNVSTQTGGQT